MVRQKICSDDYLNIALARIWFAYSAGHNPLFDSRNLYYTPGCRWYRHGGGGRKKKPRLSTIKLDYGALWSPITHAQTSLLQRTGDVFIQCHYFKVYYYKAPTCKTIFVNVQTRSSVLYSILSCDRMKELFT